MSHPYPKSYHKLKDRYEKFQKYAKPQRWLRVSIIYVFFGFILVFPLVTFLDIPFGFVFAFVGMYGSISIMWLSDRLLERKAKIYRLNADERVIFHTCHTLENLNSVFETQNEELKKECRKNALRSAKKLQSTVKANWNIGNFKLSREILGESISTFKNNLQNRLVPNIETGDEDILRTVEGILYNLAYFSDRPDLENLNNVNKSMSTQLEPITLEKRDLFSKFRMFFKTHRILRHIFVVLCLGIGCYSVYFLGVNYAFVSNDYAFGTAFGLFGVLIVGYLHYIKKEKT